MTDVKRYDPEGYSLPANISGTGTHMVEHPQGDYILAADHDRVVKELWESLATAIAQRDHAEMCGDDHVRISEKLITERDTMRAEVERLRKDAELERVMQRAASELPEGWEIRVCVERGAGWVELTNPDGEVNVDTWSGQESLSCEVSDAITAAMEASR